MFSKPCSLFFRRFSQILYWCCYLAAAGGGCFIYAWRDTESTSGKLGVALIDPLNTLHVFHEII